MREMRSWDRGMLAEDMVGGMVVNINGCVMSYELEDEGII